MSEAGRVRAAPAFVHFGEVSPERVVRGAEADQFRFAEGVSDSCVGGDTS